MLWVVISFVWSCLSVLIFQTLTKVSFTIYVYSRVVAEILSPSCKTLSYDSGSRELSRWIRRGFASYMANEVTIRLIQRLGDDWLCKHTGCDDESEGNWAHSCTSDDSFLLWVGICKIGCHGRWRRNARRVRPCRSVCHIIWYHRVKNQVLPQMGEQWSSLTKTSQEGFCIRDSERRRK